MVLLLLPPRRVLLYLAKSETSLIEGAGGQEYGKVFRGECQAYIGTEFEPQHHMASQEMLGAILSITGIDLVVPTHIGA